MQKEEKGLKENGSRSECEGKRGFLRSRGRGNYLVLMELIIVYDEDTISFIEFKIIYLLSRV